jgi:hypothetical protein
VSEPVQVNDMSDCVSFVCVQLMLTVALSGESYSDAGIAARAFDCSLAMDWARMAGLANDKSPLVPPPRKHSCGGSALLHPVPEGGAAPPVPDGGGAPAEPDGAVCPVAGAGGEFREYEGVGDGVRMYVLVATGAAWLLPHPDAASPSPMRSKMMKSALRMALTSSLVDVNVMAVALRGLDASAPGARRAA